MQGKIYGLIMLLLPLTAFWSCSYDEPLGGGMSMEGSVPVDFSFLEPEDLLGTRGTDEYKQLFVEGDVIHVQGYFTSLTGETGTAYGALRLSGRKWVPVEESTLYWPYDAEKGYFKAFYIPNSNYVLGNNTHTQPVDLSGIEDDQDPLEATSKELPYGYSVDLQFTHACTYLTMEKMEQNVTDYFWMVFPGNDDIKNAYQLSRKNGTLELEFLSIADPNENNLVYISRPSETQIGDDGQRYSMVSFYLAPGDYSYFDLRTNNNFPFMSFLNSLKESLEPNHPYILNVENAKGANFVSNTEINWDEETGGFKVDVPTFLEAVTNGTDYTEHDEYGNEVPILKKMPNGTILMMCNVDFQYFDDYDFEKWGFYPDVANGAIFNGNLHYIENIGHPVFRFNFGTIENLGLRDMKATIKAYEGEMTDLSYSKDFSRVGGLCVWNRTDARIENIRMEDFSLNVGIQAEDPRITEHNENYSIGALCGDNAGTISDITLKGDFRITVGALENTGDYAYVDASVNIGGVLGNHSAYLYNVGPQPGEDFSITITNNCRGRQEWGSGVFCIGGAVGLSSGYDISQVVINEINILATGSDGYQQYTGGLTGRLRGNGNTVSDCTVQGSLTCGTVSNFASYTSAFSYMGGISGNVRGYSVSNCRAVCSVTSNTAVSEGATYSTGGAFGRILTDSNLLNCSAYGTVLSGPSDSSVSQYIGTFAGIANENYTWADLQLDGNSARAIGNLPPIGIYLTDTSD